MENDVKQDWGKEVFFQIFTMNCHDSIVIKVNNYEEEENCRQPSFVDSPLNFLCLFQSIESKST